jgi:adenylate cyclase
MASRRLRFRTKLFAAIGLLVAAALVAALALVRAETERRVRSDFAERFARTQEAFRQLQSLRRQAVADEVDALARGNPLFRTVLSSASVAEDDLGFGGGAPAEERLRDANLRLRSLLPSLAIAERHAVFAVATASGELIYSRTEPDRFGASIVAVPPVPSALEGNDAVAVWGRAEDAAVRLPLAPVPPPDAVYEVVAEPVAFGDEVHGLVLVGTRVDRAMLDAMRAISGLDVVLLGEAGALDATLDRERAAAVAAAPRGATEVTLGGERWLLARTEIVPGAGDDGVAFAVLASIDAELAFLPALQWSFAGLGAAILAVALAVAFALARGVARPVAKLAKAAARVGKGDLATQVEIASGDELETLGVAFNAMVEGLRDREHVRRTFERHVSPEIAEAVLRDPEAAGVRGTEREVTVLFSDLAGYTTLAEGLPPETLVACLNEYFEALCDAVLATGGTVNDLLGDGVLASWGAPVAQPDHATRACRAALGANERLAVLGATWQQRRLPALRWRIGIHTGRVVAGEMGTAERAKYGIIGDAVNVASRLEGANRSLGTTILLSDDTRAALGDAFETCEIATIRVAGRTTPLVVHELLGEAGALDAARAASDERYAIALSRFRAGAFAEVTAALDGANDPRSRSLCRRATALAAAPPATWDGVIDVEKS